VNLFTYDADNRWWTRRDDPPIGYLARALGATRTGPIHQHIIHAPIPARDPVAESVRGRMERARVGKPL
jgi:hypothetical protein